MDSNYLPIPLTHAYAAKSLKSVISVFDAQYLNIFITCTYQIETNL